MRCQFYRPCPNLAIMKQQLWRARSIWKELERCRPVYTERRATITQRLKDFFQGYIINIFQGRVYFKIMSFNWHIFPCRQKCTHVYIWFGLSLCSYRLATLGPQLIPTFVSLNHWTNHFVSDVCIPKISMYYNVVYWHIEIYIKALYCDRKKH